MRVTCCQNPTPLGHEEGVAFSLFQHPQQLGVGRIAISMPQDLGRSGVQPTWQAWDFLTIALSVAAADIACLRQDSSDGWTRQIKLEVAVNKPDFWDTQRLNLEKALRFLTGDIWLLSFAPEGVPPPRRKQPAQRVLHGDCVCLFSGGTDSLVGAINEVAQGRMPVLVSQVLRGDKKRQSQFASIVGPELSHFQLSRAITSPHQRERSQRSRSIVFIAYGVIAASVLPQHRQGEEVELLIPENGFISLNIPLTPFRLGSLSTRTTHPFFLQQIQSILDAADFHIRLSNPYQLKTKGEMFVECADQHMLKQLAFCSVSCSRFQRFGLQQCGRCFPCIVRRAAFLHWGMNDSTLYTFGELSDHCDFDDVRSVAYATHRVLQTGVEKWAGAALSSTQLGDTVPYACMAERGITELRTFLEKAGVWEVI